MPARMKEELLQVARGSNLVVEPRTPTAISDFHRVIPGSSTIGLHGMNNSSTEMCSGSEAGSCLRLIDFCITQL